MQSPFWISRPSSTIFADFFKKSVPQHSTMARAAFVKIGFDTNLFFHFVSWFKSYEVEQQLFKNCKVNKQSAEYVNTSL